MRIFVLKSDLQLSWLRNVDYLRNIVLTHLQVFQNFESIVSIKFLNISKDEIVHCPCGALLAPLGRNALHCDLCTSRKGLWVQPLERHRVMV